MASYDKGDEYRDRRPSGRRPSPFDGEAAVPGTGQRGYLQAFFDKPSGNPCARAQQADQRYAQSHGAANTARVTSSRDCPEARAHGFRGEVDSHEAGQSVSLQAFFDKPSGNPYARLQKPEEDENDQGNADHREALASDPAISNDRQALQNPYAHLDGAGNFEALATQQQSRSSISMATRPTPLPIAPEQLVQNRRHGKRYKTSEIEHSARILHITLWRERHTLFPERDISDPLDLVDPSLAIRCLGMSFYVSDSLGQYSDNKGRFEVAGLIDPPSRQVRISNQFLPHIQNFTAAHELGHAVLHKGKTLHRDRALDGSGGNGGRHWIESEADKFAAAFLMPAKPLRQHFTSRFHATKLILDENTAFQIASKNQDSLRHSIQNLRDWSRLIAGTSYYQGQHFAALAEEFNVSVETMAIRLEELNLIEI
jgi:hypothetical protein